MKKIKEFFEKKQSEMKFKNAGSGHKLSDSTKPASTTLRNTEQLPSASARRTGPDANVASAALARFEGKGTSTKSTAKPTLHDIMTEEKKNIIEEMKLKDEQLEIQRMRQKAEQEEQRNPFAEFENSQKFTCHALNIDSSLSFDELKCKVKATIFDNFAEDSILRSSMILFNCNRNINQDQSQLQACLDILKKIVSNLQTENTEELQKFKKIRRSKIEQKVISFDGALDLLFAIGFTIDSNDTDWLIYVEQEGDLKKTMQFVFELLDSPQIIPFELDHQLKYITEGVDVPQEGNDDLKLTSSDFKQFYSNLEKNREINEMFISKETKSRLISNSSNFKSLFARLRFKLSLTENEIETVEAVFYSSEKLLEIKTWLVAAFSPLFDGKEVQFKVGPDLFTGDSLTQSLNDLKLSPAATLIVIAK